MSDRPIRLTAKDAEDLAVVAACLQDALVPLSEMQFLQDEHRFVMLLNRFRWESASESDSMQARGRPVDANFADAASGSQRVNSGLCIDRVVGVRMRNIDRAKPGKFLSLMTVGLDGPNKLNLLFAGDGAIQFEIEALNLFVQDFGEAWPTQWRPDHIVDGAGAAKR
jgi:Protein of unknown function (DUF2948)